MGITARRELRVLGLQRSGNHGIINWIISQSTGPLVFLNNVNPAWCSWMVPRFYVRDGDCQVTDVSDKEWLIYSLENKYINELMPMDCPAISIERQDILILRDPFNTFASWMADARLREQLIEKPGKYIDIWCDHATEYKTRETLPAALRVNFNKWVADPRYRKALADKLRLPFTDAGSDQVGFIGHGGGSSFGDRDVLNRWQIYATDSDFLSLFADGRMVDLAADLFTVPGAREAVS